MLMYDFAARTRSLDGIPMERTKVPHTRDELEQATYAGEVHARTFRSDNREDMEAYQAVLLGILDMSKARLGPDLEQYDPETKSWILFVRWVNIEGRLPAQVRQMSEYFDRK